jgi:hypothetical protein
VVAVLLCVAGLAAVVVGLAAAALEGCCGAPEAGDSTAAVAGFGVGAAAAASGVLLWLGEKPRWLVLVLAAAVPIACVVAAQGSSDLAALALPAIAAWVALAIFVSRGRAAAWLAGDHVGGGAG